MSLFENKYSHTSKVVTHHHGDQLIVTMTDDEASPAIEIKARPKTAMSFVKGTLDVDVEQEGASINNVKMDNDSIVLKNEMLRTMQDKVLISEHQKNKPKVKQNMQRNI